MQVLEVAQFGRNLPTQLVSVEPQVFQGCEVAQFGRYRARKVVFPEVKADDPPGLIGRHPIPVSERGVGQPVGAVGPVGPIGSVVQGRERLAVRTFRASRIDRIHLDDGNPGSSILSLDLGRISTWTESENGGRAQAPGCQVRTATPKIGYYLSLVVLLPIVVDHSLDGRIQISARRFALAGLCDRENRIGQRIGHTFTGQFRTTGLDEHTAGAAFDDKTADHDLLSGFHQGAGGEIDEFSLAFSGINPVHLDQGNSGSSIFSLNLGRISTGIESENDGRAQAASLQIRTATPKIGYYLSLVVLLPIVVDHSLDGRNELSARRFALAGLYDCENRIGQRIGNTFIGQFRTTRLDEHPAGAAFDDKTANHDLVSGFHQGAGGEIDEIAIRRRDRLRDAQQSRQSQQHRRYEEDQDGTTKPCA